MEPEFDSKQLFGRLIQRRRKMKGLTQEELAQKAGIKYNTLIKIEHSESIPSKESIKKLLMVLQIPQIDGEYYLDEEEKQAYDSRIESEWEVLEANGIRKESGIAKPLGFGHWYLSIGEGHPWLEPFEALEKQGKGKLKPIMRGYIGKESNPDPSELKVMLWEFVFANSEKQLA